QAQGLALPRAADHDRDVAQRRRVELLPASLDARQRLREVREAGPRRTELVAVLVVVPLEPAGTRAEDEPAAADVVQRAGHVRLQVRVAVAVAVHERAELDPFGELGPRAELGPGLEVQ